MTAKQSFAQRIFLVAGVYGVMALLPLYFMEARLGVDFPPPITHPEHFYGFIGVALAWQFAFFLISRDVQRFRLFMLPAIFEKLTFGAAVIVLYTQGRVAPMAVGLGAVDLVFAFCFVLAFRATRDAVR